MRRRARGRGNRRRPRGPLPRQRKSPCLASSSRHTTSRYSSERRSPGETPISSTHTVTEDDDVFDSGHITPGDEFVEDVHQDWPVRVPLHDSPLHARLGRASSTWSCEPRTSRSLRAGERCSKVSPRRRRAEVVLERVVPGPVEAVARATPDAEGAFRFLVRAPEPRRYRVRADSATSPLVRVRVAPRVSIERRTSGVGVRAVPTRAGAPVALQKYDRELFAFVTVARGRLDASSRAVVEYRPRGREHLRVVVRGTRGWSDGVSRPLVATP